MSDYFATPKRVKVIGNLFHGKIPDGAVYIGRAQPGLKQSPYANPWCVKHSSELSWAQQQEHPGNWVVRHHRDSSRIAGAFAVKAAAQLQAVASYREHIKERPDLLERAIAELRGRDVACWCKEIEPCHGDHLIEVVN